MSSRIRKKVSYVNVVATIALVFVMSGGAYAATKYVITSSKQISPKVLKQLAGKTGAAGHAGVAGPAGPSGPIGPTGPAGPTGPTGGVGTKGETGLTGKAGEPGPKGENGEPWTAGGTLPEGKTETGTWGLGQVRFKAGGALSMVSFSLPLTAPIEEEEMQRIVKVGQEGKEFAAECPGTLTKPEAKAGFICLYTAFSGPNMSAGIGASWDSGFFVVLNASAESEENAAYGTWAVTAPEA